LKGVELGLTVFFFADGVSMSGKGPSAHLPNAAIACIEVELRSRR
jgi:hypothetical protein